VRALVLVVALLGCDQSRHVGPRKPRYPLHPQERSASGGPIELIGAVASPGIIPYATGITLTCALRLAGGTTMFATPRGLLTRGHRRYLLPVRAIVDGTSPDLELAPGDLIQVDVVRE
jgi:protein involved in polysaccharide export with SLBB domain